MALKHICPDEAQREERVMISEHIVEQFEQEGYIVVEGLLDPPTDLAPIIAEYAHLLDRLAVKWREQGRISYDYGGFPFGQRLRKIARETRGEYFQHFEISLPSNHIQKNSPVHLGPEVFHLIRHPKILNIVEMFLGEEIYSNPMQHALLKVPERDLPEELRNQNGPGYTSWHQDQGGASMEADGTNIITVWVPITEATVENGCLVVVPGSHKQGLRIHCKGRIPEKLIGPDRRPLPMMPGDVLFMTKQIMHSSLRNRSDDIRWSFDLRYNPIGEPTGRDWFPGFVARSRANPQHELRDPESWAGTWRTARSCWAGIETPVNERDKRWYPDDPLCP
jgi:phytanoyl-CoA hydroxylase